MGRLLTGVLVVIGLIALMGGGAYLVLKRPDIPYETLAARYEDPASRYVDLPDGVHLHYREQGPLNAPTLILLHGFSASLDTWDGWSAQLQDEYRVISIDLPGHGLTRAPAGYRASIAGFSTLVNEFAQERDLRRFAIGGNSMGGNVAWEYTLAHPDRVEALILVDSAGWPAASGEGAQEPVAFKLLRHEFSAALLRDVDTTSLIREGLEKSFANPSLVTPAMVTRYSELSRAPGHRDILIQLMLERGTREVASAERLAPITAPTLILQGEQDHLVAPEHARQFHDAIAGSELVTFANAGHIPQEEIPEASVTAAREFLYRVYEGSALPAAAQ